MGEIHPEIPLEYAHFRVISTFIDIIVNGSGINKRKAISELYWEKYHEKLSTLHDFSVEYQSDSWTLNVYDLYVNVGFSEHFKIELSEHIYKAVGLFNNKDQKFSNLWIRQNNVFVFSDVNDHKNKFSQNSALTIPIDDGLINKEDMFNISMLSPVYFSAEQINLGIFLYQYLKNKNQNFLINYYIG